MTTTLELQKSLKAFGFDPGPLDGIAGLRTRAATAAFQTARGLAVTGVADPTTLAALQPTAPATALLVVDVSHYQVRAAGDDIDFAALAAAGVAGVIIKATEGYGTDSTFRRFRAGAAAAGLLVGEYLFLHPGDPQAQVDYFLSVVQPAPGACLAIDHETEAGRNASLAELRAAVTCLDQRSGRLCLVYSGALLKEQLGSHVDAFFGAHRLWLPQYAAHWSVQPSWRKPWLWQCTGSGRVPGIATPVDVSRYYGTRDQLAAEWSGAPRAPSVAAAA